MCRAAATIVYTGAIELERRLRNHSARLPTFKRQLHSVARILSCQAHDETNSILRLKTRIVLHRNEDN